MSKYNKVMEGVDSKGEVEDTTLKAKDTQKKRNEAKDSVSEDRPSQGQGQDCSRPRTKDATCKCYPRKEKKGLRAKSCYFFTKFQAKKKR